MENYKKGRILSQRKDAVKMRKWRLLNHEKSLESNRKWRKENPDKMKIAKKRWNKNNIERRRIVHKLWREKNRDKIKVIDARKYKKYPEKFKQITKARRARKKGADGSHTLKEWNRLKMECNYKCLMCSKKEPIIKLTEDHIIPLDKGGSDYIDNIQPLCRSCNAKKGTNKWNLSS